MAEPTDPAELTALKAYDEASHSLSDLQDNLPDADEEGSVDTWVTEAHQQWQIAAKNWKLAGVLDRAWRRVERSFMKVLPVIREGSLQAAVPEYNNLAERAMEFDFDVVPLPIPKSQKQRGPSSNRGLGSHSSSSPVQLRPKPTAPSTVPSQHTTPVAQTPNQLVSSTALSRPASPSLPASSDKTLVLPSTSQAKMSAPSTTKRMTGASSSLPSTGLSSLQGANPDLHLATASSYDPAIFHRPGWGFPARSPTPFSDLDSPSPSRSSYGLSFGPANLLPSSSQTNGASLDLTDPAATAPGLRPKLFAVNAKDRPYTFLAPNVSDEEEEEVQVSTLPTGDNHATPGVDNAVQDLGDSAPTGEALVRPKARSLKSKTSFVFDDDTGELDAYPTIFLSRTMVTNPQGGPLRRSSRPHEPPTHADAAYNKAAQATQSKKNKKSSKSKFQDSEVAAPRKRARNDDEGASKAGKPVFKKPRLQSVEEISDDEPVAATKAVRKRGPGLSKPPPVSIGISGGGFGEKVPTGWKPLKNGVKNIGVLVVSKDFGDFVEIDGAKWSKAVAAFVGEQYAQPCDQCRRKGTQCRKFLTHTVICVRCHYAKQPCHVDGIPALNPINHYRPKSYRTLNAFDGALDTLDQHVDALEDTVLRFLAGVDTLSQISGLRIQSSRLRECASFDQNTEDPEAEDSEADRDNDDVVGPSKSG
ncbi:hypothetical protein F5146DRAFT_1130511 [Armillaria mellea]|nr:hypothetical protein F5146DRAFT_1130511 [Armillaria mellea]